MQQSFVGKLLHSFGRRNFDLLVLCASTLLTIPLALLTGGPLRVAFAIPFIIFTPGYCLIAALYPRKDSLDAIERLALSFATSIAVVPLIGLVLNYTPWGIRMVPILLSVSAFVVAASCIAGVRRRRLTADERYCVPLTMPAVTLRTGSRADRLLSVALAASIVFAVGTLIYVVATPRQGERFTEFYILGPGGMAEGYPDVLRAGEPASLVMGIVNHEGEPVEYTVEARLNGDPAAALLEAEEGSARQGGPGSFIVGPLADEEKWEHPISAAALVPDNNGKLEFLLFSPMPRVGYHLRSLLVGCGYATIELDEVEGRATVTLNAGDESFHECRIEAWQEGSMVADMSMRVEVDEEKKFTFHHPPGRTLLKLYDGNIAIIDDTGAALTLHLWVEVGE